jgi:diguanylate cyclase (GGDEF)-like protein
MEHKYSILVVDDQETNIIMLTTILESEYTIFTADNGRSAIKAANKHLPDIILLDVLMTDMDGYEVIEELKASDITKDIPVIFVTSLDSTGDEARGLSLGAADYISKPFSSGIVKLRIKNQIKILEQLRTIEELLVYDYLTNLPNRRTLIQRIKKEWEKVVHYKKALSILVIDVDNFLCYNDTYGHEAGDLALKAVARILSKVSERPDDFAARWGGEEFVLLLPNIEINEVMNIAERILKAVENIELHVSGAAAKLTASIGVNSLRDWQDGIAVDDFMKEAYAALYEAQEKGGNQVCYNHENTVHT